LSGVAVAEFDSVTMEYRERHTGKWFPGTHLLVMKGRLDYDLIRMSDQRLRGVTVMEASAWENHEPITVKSDR